MARLLISVLALAACKGEHKAAPPKVAPRADVIPKTSVAIALDGELHEPPWNERAFRAVLAGDDGQQARPYSEIRLLHDDRALYVGLYAADQDIRSTDAWELTIGTRTLRIDATGKPSEPGIATGIDRDGTLDNPGDDDEEWVIEAAIPIPTAPIEITAKRCDTPKDGTTRCGQWHGSLALE